MEPDEIDEVKGIIDDLDQKIPRDGAKVRTHIYGGGENESQIIANRLGYLRLGIEFLKAAFAPTNKEQKHYPQSIEVDIKYLLTSNSEIYFNCFERTEDLKSDPEEESAVGRYLEKLLLLGCVMFVLLALIGLGTVIWVIIRAVT